MFLVENLTAEPVSAPIHVSAFVDERGREVRPRLGLRPATVSLGPGEQAMVRLAAELDDALESGVAYRGEIAIPAPVRATDPGRSAPPAGRADPVTRLGGARASSDRRPPAPPGKAAAASRRAGGCRGRTAAAPQGSPALTTPGAGPTIAGRRLAAVGRRRAPTTRA